MSIWFLIWLALSAFLLYFLFWTLYILLKQKQGWKAYAEKKKLRFRAPSFLGAPEITGTIDGYTTHILIAEHTSADGRSVRKLTAIEMNMASKMPMDGAIASAGMVPLVQALNLKEEYRPDYMGWSAQHIAASSSLPALKTYLTPERLEALTSLMKIKNIWVILVFRGDVSFLRLDTPSALENPKKMEALINRMIKTVKLLELTPGEDQLLKTEAAKITKEYIITPPASTAASFTAPLELEEEESPSLQSSPPPGEPSVS